MRYISALRIIELLLVTESGGLAAMEYDFSSAFFSIILKVCSHEVKYFPTSKVEYLKPTMKFRQYIFCTDYRTPVSRCGYATSGGYSNGHAYYVYRLMDEEKKA